jgi:hypothetical protein
MPIHTSIWFGFAPTRGTLSGRWSQRSSDATGEAGGANDKAAKASQTYQSDAAQAGWAAAKRKLARRRNHRHHRSRSPQAHHQAMWVRHPADS